VIKVLYIEDNDDNVYMLKMRLELLDEFEVLTAEDGEKGCEMAAAERPDIVLMDLEMPGIDGWEATRRLKSNPDTRTIRILGVTGYPEGVPQLLAAGADAVLKKPLALDDVESHLGRLLD